LISFLGTAVAQAGQSEPLPLQLEVSVNGHPLKLIGAFAIDGAGRIGCSAAELRDLGIKPPEGATDDTVVMLDTLAGVTYTYDQAAQAIDIKTGDAGRIRKTYNAKGDKEPLDVQTSWGMILNYSALVGASRDDHNKGDFIGFDGASLTLEHRAYSPAGVLANSAIVESEDEDSPVLRLDSSYTYSHRDLAMTATVGDLISGGLPWTRPIRMGGVQLRRNFDIRPDLITMPLPEFSGSAEVPSTVDIYVNNVKAYSRDIPAGPYAITNVPVVTGGGEARVVVRDASGKETETIAPFFASADLLRPGFYDYSAELGVARPGFGVSSFGYDDHPIGSGSFRYGFTDWLTGEVHAEGGDGLINGGAGLVATAGVWAVIAAAGSVSQFNGETGVQLYAQVDTEIAGIDLSASTIRTFGAYADLGYAIAYDPLLTAAQLSDLAPPKALDRINAGIALPEDWGGLGLGALHIEDNTGEHSYILSANYIRPLPWRASLTVTGFAQFGADEGLGIFAGASMPLGSWGSGSAGVTADHNGIAATASVSRPVKAEPGSFGWRAQVQQGEETHGQATLSYRAEFLDAEARAAQIGDATQADISVEGALVLADGGLFATRRIEDAFAVADVGTADVPVFLDNQPVGKTGTSGKLLVTGLHSYEKNRISIDAENLPIDADVPETTLTVVPAERSGAIARFGVERTTDSALVIFRDATGAYLPAGAEVALEGGEAPFVIGYDGQAYMTGLKAQNVVTVTLAEGTCRAEFGYAKATDGQSRIDDVVCK
jgi:outer membrane usher protein